MAFTINLRNIRTLFGKTKTRSQMCLVATEDGRLMPAEILVRKGCAVDDDRVSAWLIDAENHVRDDFTGIWYQLVGERSSVPICPIKDREKFKREKKDSNDNLWKLIKGIFHESWVTDLIMLNRKAEQNKNRNMTIIFLGAPVLIAALIIGIKVIRS